MKITKENLAFYLSNNSGYDPISRMSEDGEGWVYTAYVSPEQKLLDRPGDLDYFFEKIFDNQNHTVYNSVEVIM